jgi:DNA-binding NarL/FixJ family response regulator
MTDPPPPLDIRDPGLTDVLGDADALSLWELLRRARTPTEAGVLAEATDLRLDRVPTWRATREAIIVGYRVNDPLDEVLTGCMDELLSPEWRRRIRQHIRPPAEDGTASEPSEDRFTAAWAGRWGRAERKPFWDLMLELPRLLHASTVRFLGATPSKAQSCTHLLEIHLAPLEPGVPEWPLIRMVPLEPAGGEPGGVASTSGGWVLGERRPAGRKPGLTATLTGRERAVARLIDEGRSPDEIAARLHIAAGTVARHAEAIRRTLGVDRFENAGPVVERGAGADGAVSPAPSRRREEGRRDEPAPMLDLQSPGLAAMLADADQLAIWERLRRLGRPAAAAELAESFAWDLARVEAALGSLASVGLAVVAAEREGERRDTPHWRIARDAIAVGYRPGNAGDEAMVAALERVHGEARRRTVHGHAKTFKTRRADEELHRATITAALVPEEVRRIREILGSLARHFRATAVGRGDGAPEPPWCTYHLTVSLDPLVPGILPQPTVEVVGMHRVDEVARSIEERIARLSNRERTVAMALRDGLDRRRIAESLGVSMNTVATLVKRFYAKLGVRSRSELSRRLGMRGERA